ncbi:MAG TPA: hypothetical protein VG936_17440 [Lacunisphaera sp.]|nr:hypothetical protein [Lacunisphaera sp.]
MSTFRELYCARHGIAPGRFEHVLIRRCLHWQARPFAWVLRLNRDYFAPDFEFARAVGELRSRRGFRAEAAEFHYHPKNRGLLRSVLRLRVSSQRLQSIFEREIRENATQPPFDSKLKRGN